MKKKIIIISLFVLMLDQLIKLIISTHLINFNFIPNFLSLIYVENTGVAFSMLSGNRLFIILMTILLLGVLIYMLEKEDLNSKRNSKSITWSYGLLFGGILGNLVDRIIRGVVVDYVSFKIFGYYFPVFNLADLMITIGVIILVVNNVKNVKK